MTAPKPMTLADKLRGLADIAERDPRDVQWRLECLLNEFENEAFKADMGGWMSSHLGDR